MDVSVGVVLLLVDLVTHGVFGGRGTGAEGCVAVFGDVWSGELEGFIYKKIGWGRTLVALLRSGRSGLLNLLRRLVHGVPEKEVRLGGDEEYGRMRKGRAYLMVSIMCMLTYEL